MVQQAGDEVGRSAADRQSVALDQLEHPARIPDVAQIDRRALQHRDQEGAEHADEVPDRRGGQLPAAVGRVVRQQLAGLEAQRLMAVDDALRVAGRARGERDQRRAGRIGGMVPTIGSSASRSSNGRSSREPAQRRPGRRSARRRTGPAGTSSGRTPRR